ncbi:SusC/RagA family TonB-linked outer membrane protein [Pontibacter diazotrophicus]|nr:TonB-dependent receptor [Pontibacter diazotrophicus]
MKRSSHYLQSIVLASLLIGFGPTKAQTVAVALPRSSGAVYSQPANLPPKDVLAEEQINRQTDVTVTGKVTGETGDGLPGVTVMLKGTNTGVTTDVDGNYRLNVPNGSGTLVFSYIGYEPQEVPVNNRAAINISLAPDTEALEEVVVIGYGSQKKREVTGAVASVKPEDFNQGAVTDAMQLVQGKVAGLSVTRTNGGDPTSGLEIRLRGTSSLTNSGQAPLIVVDGIPGGSLEAISPDDIASIDILKDGSAAAIYGTRGTNGVILITTKQGKKGAMQVAYSGRAYTESTLRRVEVLSAAEYREMKERLSVTRPDVASSMIDYGASTDWYDEITRTPLSHLHNLSLSGGMENTTYRLSMFYVDHEGILLNSNKEEYRANLNMSQRALNDKLQFTAQLGMANVKQNPVDYNAMRQVVQRNPTEPVYDEDGNLTEFIGAWQYDNPVGILTERVRDDAGSRLFGNLGVNFDLTDEIRVGVLGGLQTYRAQNGYYEPSYSYPQQLANLGGFASRNSEVRTTETLESTIEWMKSFSEHSINLIGGYSFQEFGAEGFNAGNSNFITDDFAYNNIGSGTYLTDGRASMGSFKNESRLVGFFARGAYNFRGRYFLFASVRREGSSKFGANNKWGTFPAVSAGWDITQEDFLSGVPNLNLLKLRAGYGVTGNQGIDPYLSLQRLGASGLFYYNGEFIPGYQPVSNPNPNLKWETKHEYNVGVDWAVLGNRISGTVDWYLRDTRDLLLNYNVPTPPNLFTSTLANVGSLRNTGIELTINAIPVQTEGFQWSVDFNIDHRRNKLLSLSNEFYSLDYRNIGDIGPPGISAWTHQLREGAPLGIIHGLVYEGLTDDGQWIYRDYDPRTGESDDEINIDDRADIGNGIPDYYMGLTNTFKYGNFDLTVMARGMFGHQIINTKRIWHDNPKFLPRNIMRSAMDSQLWDDPDFSSYYVEDGDFVKIDNITLGYNLPLQNKWIKSSRFYLTGNNMFVITGYQGVDPEVAIGGLEPGSDNRFDYPSTRMYTAGINLTF